MWTLGYLVYAYGVDKATFRLRLKAEKDGVVLGEKIGKHTGTSVITTLNFFMHGKKPHKKCQSGNATSTEWPIGGKFLKRRRSKRRTCLIIYDSRENTMSASLLSSKKYWML